MREIVIDCSGVGSAEAFWQRYLDVVQPEDAARFGRNLDAFWDAIEGGGPGWPGDVALVFKQSAQLSGIGTGDGSASLLDALKAIANEASRVRISFAD